MQFSLSHRDARWAHDLIVGWRHGHDLISSMRDQASPGRAHEDVRDTVLPGSLNEPEYEICSAPYVALVGWSSAPSERSNSDFRAVGAVALNSSYPSAEVRGFAAVGSPFALDNAVPGWKLVVEATDPASTGRHFVARRLLGISLSDDGIRKAWDDFLSTRVRFSSFFVAVCVMVVVHLYLIIAICLHGNVGTSLFHLQSWYFFRSMIVRSK